MQHNLQPSYHKRSQVLVYADFAGSWSQANAHNAENILSKKGQVIMYAKFLILWVSRLQTEIALSTAKAEYIALSQALRNVIPLITLLKEINSIFPCTFKSLCLYAKCTRTTSRASQWLQHNGLPLALSTLP